MSFHRPSITRRSARAFSAALVAGALGLSGCATGYQSFRDGQTQLAEGRTEAGLAKLHEAMDQNPSNGDFRRSYLTQRETALNSALNQAERALELGDFVAARGSFALAARLDPSNSRAAGGLSRVEAAERQWQALDAAQLLAKSGRLDEAITKTQQVLSENPQHRRASLQLRQLMRQQADASGKELGIYPKLKASYRVPVSLTFSNATLLQVFEALKQASGLNYMIERDVKPDLRVTLSVQQKPVEDIVRLILATNQLERRVLDDDTLLIYPNTPAKATEYREMVVRSFYLSNADATKVAAAVRTIAKARDVVVDEKLNLVIVRDSADVVRLAEKLIAAQDLADPEVMLELEVMEVSVSRLMTLGIQWPSSVSAGVTGSDGVAGQLRLNELRNRNSGMVKLNISDPLLGAQVTSTAADANLLANPRVRVRNKQSAKILIGQRVPVITTTATASVGTSESVNYLDVGLKLDIEPTISLDDEVSMKVALEVSNIISTITRASGTQVYQLGTRNTSTSLRVRDGETNILAGLIQREERHSNTGVPGLNEIPVVNRLFGVSQDNDDKTEIVLLITPHIVRNLDVPGVGLQEFLSGTDAAVGAAPIQLGNPANAGRPGGVPSALPAPWPNGTPPAGLAPAPVTMPAQMPALSSNPNSTAPAPGSPPPAFIAPPLIPATPSGP